MNEMIMNKKLLRIVLLFLLGQALLGGVDVKAQMVVHDPISMAKEIKNFFTEMEKIDEGWRREVERFNKVYNSVRIPMELGKAGYHLVRTGNRAIALSKDMMLEMQKSPWLTPSEKVYMARVYLSRTKSLKEIMDKNKAFDRIIGAGTEGGVSITAMERIEAINKLVADVNLLFLVIKGDTAKWKLLAAERCSKNHEREFLDFLRN